MSRPVVAQTEASSTRRVGLGIFLLEAVRNHAVMGAIAPTSASAARRIAQVVPEQSAGTVVELGAGTGAISGAIGGRLGPGGRHLAVERQAEMLAAVVETAPWAECVHGDAADLAHLLEQVGLYRVDAVVSSLPWGNFPDAIQRRILDEVVRVLMPDGVFVTIVYRPTRMRASSRRFHAALREHFDETIESRTIWRNLPPARLQICRRPLKGGSEWLA